MHHVYPAEHPETPGICSFKSSQQTRRALWPATTNPQVKSFTHRASNNSNNNEGADPFEFISDIQLIVNAFHSIY